MRDHPETAAGLRVVSLDVVPEYTHMARASPGKASQNADHGGLAGTIGTQEAEKLALFDVQTHAIKRQKGSAFGATG